MDEERSSLVAALLVWLAIGLVVTLLGARDVFEVVTEDCPVGTEHQRCTPGQGRVMLGVGLVIILSVGTTLAIAIVRRGRHRPHR